MPFGDEVKKFFSYGTQHLSQRPRTLHTKFRCQVGVIHRLLCFGLTHQNWKSPVSKLLVYFLAAYESGRVS